MRFDRKNFIDEMINSTLKYQKKYEFDAGVNNNSTWNNEAVAFKHAFMQWDLCYENGVTIAKKIGDSHELNKKNNSKNEQNMDLWNNAVGREVYYEIKNMLGDDISFYSKENLNDIAADIIYRKMRAGEMITSLEDPRKFENMELERLREEDRVFYKGEYSTFDDKYKSRIMPYFVDQMYENDGKFSEKSALDKRVLSGELIYVDNYIKADGTQVHGYYRRKEK